MADQNIPKKDNLDIFIDEIEGKQHKELKQQISQEKLTPISNKKFVLKLIPFILICVFALGIFIACMILPTSLKLQGDQKLSLYLLGPILLVCFAPFAFYAFTWAYVKKNLVFNEKLKRFLSKILVPQYSKNGCFPLKKWYTDNPLLYAWDMKATKIISAWHMYNPTDFDETIKYYKEHSFEI